MVNEKQGFICRRVFFIFVQQNVLHLSQPTEAVPLRHTCMYKKIHAMTVIQRLEPTMALTQSQ